MRSSTSREVEWDDEQQALLLALAVYRAQLCSRGHFLPTTGAEAAEDSYVVEAPERCHVCTALLAAQRAHTDGAHAPHPEALVWRAVRR